VCDDLGLSVAQRTEYVPSPIAQQVRAYLEAAYQDDDAVVALLAVAEQEVILFRPPLREATRALGIDVVSGYYHVHGVSSDAAADAADDNHEDDRWIILIWPRRSNRSAMRQSGQCACGTVICGPSSGQRSCVGRRASRRPILVRLLR
jgi:hypothetical protein